MRPLKKSFHQKWQQWFLNAEKTKTRFDNIRSPGYAQVITWVSEKWTTLNPNVIRASFDLCGITQNKHDQLHSQLQAFLTKSMVDMVVDVQPEDELRGCFVTDNDICSNTDDLEETVDDEIVLTNL
jgi:hypothetical protein